MKRWRNLALLLLALVVINLPEVAGVRESRRVSRDGVEVQARVTDQRHTSGDYFLSFAVDRGHPRPGDRAFTGTARVDEPTYRSATASGRVGVEVVPGSTSAWRIDGQVTGHLGLVLTLVADFFLLLMALLYARFGARPPPKPLVLRAEQDLERCPPRAVIERLDGARYFVCGEVEAIELDAVVLDLGDRRVRVILDGHHNPAGYQQSVMVTGTLVG